MWSCTSFSSPSNPLTAWVQVPSVCICCSTQHILSAAVMKSFQTGSPLFTFYFQTSCGCKRWFKCLTSWRNRSVAQIKETLNGGNECLSVSESTRMGDSACQPRASLRLKCRQWPNPVKWEQQQGYTESSDGLLCPPSLCSLNSSCTKDIVIPPLITRWRAVCLPRSSALPRNKVLCGYDPRRLWNSLVDNRARASPHFLIQLLQYESELHLHRDHFICTQSACLCDGQSVQSFPVPARFRCQNQSCLRHVTNFTVLVLGRRI